jgi:hypothetical protein
VTSERDDAAAIDALSRFADDQLFKDREDPSTSA